MYSKEQVKKMLAEQRERCTVNVCNPHAKKAILNTTDPPFPIIQKPPLGLRPKYIMIGDRKDEIIQAMTRYFDAGKEIPQEWTDEYNEYCK